jgi:hypothetical protein
MSFSFKGEYPIGMEKAGCVDIRKELIPDESALLHFTKIVQ